MHLQIFYPGGVSYGTLSDNASDMELYNALYLAATIEEGNGNGKIKQREQPELDDPFSKKIRNKR